MTHTISFPTSRRGRRALIAGAAATASVATVAGVALGLSGPAAPSPTSGALAATDAATSSGGAASSAGGAHARGLDRYLARADHAELEVRGKSGWVTVEVDRGKVLQVSSGSITVLRPDGGSVTETLTAKTKEPQGAPTVGAHVVVVSVSGTARSVRIPSARAAAPTSPAAPGSPTS